MLRSMPRPQDDSPQLETCALKCTQQNAEHYEVISGSSVCDANEPAIVNPKAAASYHASGLVHRSSCGPLRSTLQLPIFLGRDLARNCRIGQCFGCLIARMRSMFAPRITSDYVILALLWRGLLLRRNWPIRPRFSSKQNPRVAFRGGAIAYV
jgi:hypothetical protein